MSHGTQRIENEMVIKNFPQSISDAGLPDDGLPKNSPNFKKFQSISGFELYKYATIHKLSFNQSRTIPLNDSPAIAFLRTDDPIVLVAVFLASIKEHWKFVGDRVVEVLYVVPKMR